MARAHRLLALAPTMAARGAAAPAHCRCVDASSSCWPSDAEWSALNDTVHGRLVAGAAAGSPVQICGHAGEEAACDLALERSSATEFWNRKFPGGFQSTGLVDGFQTRASEFAVQAASAEDVAAAVRFAAAHDLRLVVKGSGHDYMGRNTATAAGSLLISTVRMLDVSWGRDDAHVTVAAGVPWQDVYLQAQERGVFVQGGHCPSVGAVGGFSAGGGFGPNSRMYGTGADNMLAATVVLASGEVLDVDEARHADLFWALRGGGGGTFGVVTSITYRTHPAPRLGGSMSGALRCPSGDAFVELLSSFLVFAGKHLFTPHWGDSATPDGAALTLEFGLRYIGLSQQEAQATWQPFVDAVSRTSCDWSGALSFQDEPRMRLANGTEVVKQYPFPGAWYPQTGDPEVDARLVDGFLGQLNQWSFGQAHRYILQEEVETDPRGVAQKLLELTKFRTSYRVLQFSKALAGAAAAGNVSSNPVVRRAGMALMGNEHVANYFPDQPRNRVTLANLARAGGVQGFFSGGLCPKPDGVDACFGDASLSDAQVEACWTDMLACFQHRSDEFHTVYTPALREAFRAGSYGNEGDYFEPEWQTQFWGENYGRLLEVKRRVDPSGLFVCHHCVGSEDWSADGNCRKQSSRFVV